jgi:hypothetical protein
MAIAAVGSAGTEPGLQANWLFTAPARSYPEAVMRKSIAIEHNSYAKRIRSGGRQHFLITVGSNWT